MLTYFPAIEPYAEHEIKLTNGQSLHVEECGNPTGLPILVLHGGPGQGVQPYLRQLFNPEVYRIILFDQRGTGRSKPHATLEDNTVNDLLSDIEYIREHLAIHRWLVAGGGWGSFLALTYSTVHPQVVTGIMVWSVCLGQPQDVDWIFEHGLPRLFPEQYAQLKETLSLNKGGMTLVKKGYEQLTGEDEVASMNLAKIWTGWLNQCGGISHHNEKIHNDTLSCAKISAHYYNNQFFKSQYNLLDNLDKINKIPGIIIQARYNVFYPLDNAWTLYNAWSESDMQIVPTPGNVEANAALIDAIIRNGKILMRHHT